MSERELQCHGYGAAIVPDAEDGMDARAVCSPARYTAQYASAKDLQDRFGDTLSQIIGGGDSVGNPLVRRALSDATAEADSYLQGRFLLPIPFVPPVLTQITADIAIYRLLVLRPDHAVEDARRRYEDAIKRLERIRKGQLDLGLPLPDSPAIVGHVQITGDKRLFTRGSLREA